MINLIREIGKLCMFIVMWAMPIVLAHLNQNNHFLWFFALSFLVTIGIFNHYETLEQWEFRESNSEDNE